MLRIAFIAQDFPPDVGGTHVYNVEYARRLTGLGHELRVFTWTSRTDATAAADSEQPFEVHRQPYLRRSGGLSPAGLADALARWRPQAIFVSGSCAAMGHAVREAARYAPVTVAVHDLRDKGRERGRLRRWRARRRYGYDAATRFSADSEHNRGCLERLGVAAERIRVVHPGVDTDHFSPDPASGAKLRAELGLGERPLLLTVARLAPNKGHARVIDALPRVGREVPDLAYAVVGDGELRDALEQRARDRGVADRVHFAGRVPDTRPWYQACDVFVMASTPHGRGLKAGEGFGIAYVEAGACGKPVVASSSGGGAEIVIEGETGHVVRPDDETGLARALASLLASPARARAWGQRGRERVARYDWREGARELESLLRDAVAAGGR